MDKLFGLELCVLAVVMIIAGLYGLSINGIKETHPLLWYGCVTGIVAGVTLLLIGLIVVGQAEESHGSKMHPVRKH